MESPKLVVKRTTLNGSPAVVFGVSRSIQDPELHAVVLSLGFTLVVDISNYYESAPTSDHAKVAATQDAFRPFFVAGGLYKGAR